MIKVRIETPPNMYSSSKSEEIEALKRYLYKQAQTLNLALDSLQAAEDRITKLENQILEGDSNGN